MAGLDGGTTKRAPFCLWCEGPCLDLFCFQAGWLPGEDSNHDSRLQRPLSYHWTTGEFGERAARSHPEISLALPRRRNHQSEYGVPSRLVLSDPLRTSKMPGSVWLVPEPDSSMIVFQLLFEPVIGSSGTCRR